MRVRLLRVLYAAKQVLEDAEEVLEAAHGILRLLLVRLVVLFILFVRHLEARVWNEVRLEGGFADLELEFGGF